MDWQTLAGLKKGSLSVWPSFCLFKTNASAYVKHDCNLGLHDLKVLCCTLLIPGEYLQWRAWYDHLAHDQARQNAMQGGARGRITFEWLTGTGIMANPSDLAAEAFRFPEFFETVAELALEAWDHSTPSGESQLSYMKIVQ